MGIAEEDSYDSTPKVGELAQAPVLIGQVEILAEPSAGHFGAVEALSTRGWFTAAGDYTQ
jgi:hypothetical protein